ncbi:MULTISPECIES: hypothetical protein [unclassified Streptomyces]
MAWRKELEVLVPAAAVRAGSVCTLLPAAAAGSRADAEHGFIG